MRPNGSRATLDLKSRYKALNKSVLMEIYRLKRESEEEKS